MIKIDPYLNVDAGTMNPFQHGEVYVTDDGAETDLDLGNYSRFTTSPLGRDNSITTGQIYQAVISREREGRFLGKTVQVIPHITDEIKARIFRVGEQPGVDVTMVEIGGTVGDIESIPFLEAARQFIHDIGRENVHVRAPHPRARGLHGRAEDQAHPALRARAARDRHPARRAAASAATTALEDDLRRKISLFTNVDKEAVISAYDVRTTIYEIPLVYAEQKLDEIIVRKLRLPAKGPARDGWRSVRRPFPRRHAHGAGRPSSASTPTCTTPTSPSSRRCSTAAMANDARVELVKVEGEELEDGGDLAEVFGGCDGMLVPGGFGSRGIEGMIRAARWARGIEASPASASASACRSW